MANKKKSKKSLKIYLNMVSIIILLFICGLALISTINYNKTNKIGFTTLEKISDKPGNKYVGLNAWTDGKNAYYSSGKTQLVFNTKTNTWVKKKWKGIDDLEYLDGCHIWTDGKDIYYSSSKSDPSEGNVEHYIHYILDGDTWKPKKWKGLTEFMGWYIWSDGVNTYCSDDNKHYILDGNTWKEYSWNGIDKYGNPINFCGYQVWNNGENIYHLNFDDNHYILKNKKWKPVTLKCSLINNFKQDSITSNNIWSDGENTYVSSNNVQFVLDDDTWRPKKWKGFSEFTTLDIFTDGTNYYCSTEKGIYKFK